MNGLVSHVNTDIVTLEQLGLVPVPSETATYMPISHDEMARNIRRIGDDMLIPKGYVFQTEQYALGRDGQRVFGVFQYANGSPDMGLAIGWRNSYDKSMSAGLCIGAQVFVCDNLAFHGDVTILRRHTKNLHEDLMTQLLGALYKSTGNYLCLRNMAERFKTLNVMDNQAYSTIGMLRGNDVLSPRLESIAFEEWKHPRFECFQPRTVWSLYNAATFALKECPVQEKFELHNRLTEMFVSEWPSKVIDIEA